MMPSMLTLPVTESVLLRPSILEGPPPAMVLLYSGPSGRGSAHRSQASSASSQRASAWPKPWLEYTVSQQGVLGGQGSNCPLCGSACSGLHHCVSSPQMIPTRRLYCPVFSPSACTLKAPFDQTKLMKTWPSHAPACMCLL